MSEDRIKLTRVFNQPDGEYEEYDKSVTYEKGEFIEVEEKEPSLWETRITVNARQEVKISPTQTMTETKTYDVTDFLTQKQLDHILDCIQPINEI